MCSAMCDRSMHRTTKPAVFVATSAAVCTHPVRRVAIKRRVKEWARDDNKLTTGREDSSAQSYRRKGDGNMHSWTEAWKESRVNRGKMTNLALEKGRRVVCYVEVSNRSGPNKNYNYPVLEAGGGRQRGSFKVLVSERCALSGSERRACRRCTLAWTAFSAGGRVRPSRGRAAHRQN